MVYPLLLVDILHASKIFPVSGSNSIPYCSHSETFGSIISPLFSTSDFIVMIYTLSETFNSVVSLITPFFSVGSYLHEAFEFMLSPPSPLSWFSPFPLLSYHPHYLPSPDMSPSPLMHPFLHLVTSFLYPRVPPCSSTRTATVKIFHGVQCIK